MSGIRVNEWLHNSGTGGIWQTSAGNVGIASSVPTTKLEVTGDAKISGVTTAATFIQSEGQLSNRNLVINGAMNVAQRGTSDSGASGGMTCDRFGVYPSGADEAPTQSQHSLTTSDTGPYEAGFRNSLHVQNGNQTSGAGTADNCRILYKIEAQDLANSGWNYKSATSYLTLSFWVKSSVAQNFYMQIRTLDGTGQSYPMETGSLTADTWTKVTKTIPGLASGNIDVNDDSGAGMEINWWQFLGTDSTGSVSLDTWAAYSGSTRTPNQTSTWWTTNDATFELTGVQIEVGQKDTPFEHEPHAQTLNKCLRYYEQFNSNGLTEAPFCSGYFESDTNGRFCLNYHPKRGQPTLTFSAASTWTCLNTNNIPAATAIATQKVTETAALITVTLPSVTDGNGRSCILVSVSGTEATILVDAEI